MWIRFSVSQITSEIMNPLPFCTIAWTEKRHTAWPVPTQADTNTEETCIDVYIPSGIRTHNPSAQTIEDNIVNS